MTTLSEQLEAEQAWSIIGNKPVSVYIPKYDAHLVYWYGVAMTRSYALLLISTCWMKMYHSSSVKEAAWNDYNRVYRLGAFGHHDWDKTITTTSYHEFPGFLMKMLNRKSNGNIKNLIENYSAQEATLWLDTETEKILKSTTDD